MTVANFGWFVVGLICGYGSRYLSAWLVDRTHRESALAPRDSAPTAHAFEPCHKGFDTCAHRDKPDEFPCNKPRAEHRK